MRVSVELDLRPYGISQNEAVHLIDEAGRRELERSGATAAVCISLATRGACIVEVAKKTSI